MEKEVLNILNELDKKYGRLIYEQLKDVIRRKNYSKLVTELKLIFIYYFNKYIPNDDTQDVTQRERELVSKVIKFLERYYLIEKISGSLKDLTH